MRPDQTRIDHVLEYAATMSYTIEVHTQDRGDIVFISPISSSV